MKYFLFFLVLLVQTSSSASEQVNFEIAYDRSINIESEKNRQSLKDIGDSVTINAKGRLWLTGNETNQGYDEILCQSKSLSPISVQLHSSESPWITLSEPAKCGKWNNNLLVCTDNKIEKAVFCLIKQQLTQQSLSTKPKRRTTSVAVRSLKSPELQPKSSDYREIAVQTIQTYTTGTELCKHIYPKESSIVINWDIYDGGTTGNIKVDNKDMSENDTKYTNCLIENIKLWNFPNWKKNFKIKYRF